MTTLQTNDYNQTVSTKTASYTLVAADVGTKIVMNSASATAITVNTSLFTAGDTLTILNIGAGVCTVTAGTATVASAGSLGLKTNQSGTLYFTSAGVSVFQTNGVTGGYVLNTQAFATTGISNMTQTTILTGTAIIFPNRLYSAYGFCCQQSGSTIGARGLWFEETNSGKEIGLSWAGTSNGANLPFTMAGTQTFTAADVGVTTGSGTSRTFNLRVYFNGGVVGLNTDPDVIVGTNTFPQTFTITDIGNS
jgi:hypothetical protein